MSETPMNPDKAATENANLFARQKDTVRQRDQDLETYADYDDDAAGSLLQNYTESQEEVEILNGASADFYEHNKDQLQEAALLEEAARNRNNK